MDSQYVMLMLRICRPAGAFRIWMAGFYRDIAPPALGCRHQHQTDLGAGSAVGAASLYNHPEKDELAPFGAAYSGRSADSHFVTYSKYASYRSNSLTKRHSGLTPARRSKVSLF